MAQSTVLTVRLFNICLENGAKEYTQEELVQLGVFGDQVRDVCYEGSIECIIPDSSSD